MKEKTSSDKKTSSYLHSTTIEWSADSSSSQQHLSLPPQHHPHSTSDKQRSQAVVPNRSPSPMHGPAPSVVEYDVQHPPERTFQKHSMSSTTGTERITKGSSVEHARIHQKQPGNVACIGQTGTGSTTKHRKSNHVHEVSMLSEELSLNHLAIQEASIALEPSVSSSRPRATHMAPPDSAIHSELSTTFSCVVQHSTSGFLSDNLDTSKLPCWSHNNNLACIDSGLLGVPCMSVQRIAVDDSAHSMHCGGCASSQPTAALHEIKDPGTVAANTSSVAPCYTVRKCDGATASLEAQVEARRTQDYCVLSDLTAQTEWNQGMQQQQQHLKPLAHWKPHWQPHLQQAENLAGQVRPCLYLSSTPTKRLR